MPTLIACLTTGKGSWTEVSQLIKIQPWDKIFLITTRFGEEKFSLKQDNLNLVVVDSFQGIEHIAEKIRQQLKDKIRDWEVALNLSSGSGKEHMALLKAVMDLGLSFRLVALVDNRLRVF